MKLEVHDLAIERGGEIVFSGKTFELSSGSAMVVTGENGAGKSTLLLALAGQLPIHHGSVSWTGKPTEFSESTLPELAHYLGPQNQMKPELSVSENLHFWQNFHGRPHLDVDEALDMVGLVGIDHLPFGHLSTGQRRRIAIAKLLVSWRPVWLLDEPTSGLDKASETQFSSLMQAHLEDDGIIVAATHIPLGLENAQSLVLGQDNG